MGARGSRDLQRAAQEQASPFTSISGHNSREIPVLLQGVGSHQPPRRWEMKALPGSASPRACSPSPPDAQPGNALPRGTVNPGWRGRPMQPVPAGAPGASGQVILPPAGARRGLTSRGHRGYSSQRARLRGWPHSSDVDTPSVTRGPILGEGLGPGRFLHTQAGRAVPGPDLRLRGGSWAGVEEVFGLPCARAGAKNSGSPRS